MMTPAAPAQKRNNCKPVFSDSYSVVCFFCLCISVLFYFRILTLFSFIQEVLLSTYCMPGVVLGLCFLNKLIEMYKVSTLTRYLLGSVGVAYRGWMSDVF